MGSAMIDKYLQEDELLCSHGMMDAIRLLRERLAAERQKVAELVEALGKIRTVARNSDAKGYARDFHEIIVILDAALARNGGKEQR